VTLPNASPPKMAAGQANWTSPAKTTIFPFFELLQMILYE